MRPVAVNNMCGEQPHEPQPPPLEFTPEERVEFEFWRQLGDEAWAMILDWEAEEDTANSNDPPRTETQ